MMDRRAAGRAGARPRQPWRWGPARRRPAAGSREMSFPCRRA